MNRQVRAITSELRRRVGRAFDTSWRTSLARNQGQAATLLGQIFYAQMRDRPRYQDARRLIPHGFKVYSMHDEDGIISEIFRRIETTDRLFVEFGVGDGLENNTLYLLLKRWRGIWIEGSAKSAGQVSANLRNQLQDGLLRLKQSYITADNIVPLFEELRVPEEFDFLSIDIDGNDYWVWKALARYRPRVVAIEYNASLGPEVSCVVPYDPEWLWDVTNYGGASLAALEGLGREKGYSLVGCNFTGGNAFFVRSDLVQDRFHAPFTAANHFEPPRYFVRMPSGWPTSFGPFEYPDHPQDPASMKRGA